MKHVLEAGVKLVDADRALILLHGRGGSAEDILGLADHLPVDGYALLAPQAPDSSWYPLSFLAPPVRNQPFLDASLRLLGELVAETLAAGIGREKLFFAGFSQGACLTLEFVARHATRYGGVVAFTGGLIGDRISPENYSGAFDGTPFFITGGEPDPHVPADRVRATVKVLREMGAAVNERLYPGR
ncbi:MAG TPA: dienelactone hydrolase family protein, partial [Puia sp.]|nr:dienelactone hydrolase family protein [Puia sp.]